MPSSSIDLIFTSPPYWEMRGEIEWGSLDEYFNKMRRIMEEVVRVVKPGRIVGVNMSDYIVEGERLDLNWQWHKLLKELGLTYRDTIIWHKTGELATISAGKMASNFVKYQLPMYYSPDRVMEVILVFSKGKPVIPRYNATITEMSKVKIDEVREYLRNVWSIPPRQDKQHPAVFPEKLAELMIKFYSYVGETVLDPFGGVGTVGRVAKRLNRSAILCEINPEYVKRIKREIGWGEVCLTGEFQYEYIFEEVVE